jgi:hypothetical protein
MVHSFLVTGMCAPEFVALCGVERRDESKPYDTPPAKTKKCPECETKWQELINKTKKLVDKDGKPTERAVSRFPEEGDIKRGDIWETKEYKRQFRVLLIKGDIKGFGEEFKGVIDIQWLDDNVKETLHEQADRTLFYKLVCRVLRVIDEEPEFPTPPTEEMSQKTLKGVKDHGSNVKVGESAKPVKPEVSAQTVQVGDVWKWKNGWRDRNSYSVKVLCVDFGIVFLRELDERYASPRHDTNTIECLIHNAVLVERDGKPIKVKRPMPNHGMDLVNHSIHECDLWQDIHGYNFRVVNLERDVQGKVVRVPIKWETVKSTSKKYGEFEEFTSIDPNTFHYLIERNGVDMTVVKQ